MQTNQLDQQTLRRLADLYPKEGKVLTLFLDLDPSQYGTTADRETAINSLLNQADKRVKDEEDGLSHDEQNFLRADLSRAREFFGGDEFDPKGAHGLAVFLSSGADIFEAIKLPRPIEPDVIIDDSPYIEPLVDLALGGRWAVCLVNRSTGRIFRGSADALEEIAVISEDVHGQDQKKRGGRSTTRYEPSVEEDKRGHFERVAAVLHRRFQRRRFDHLLLGTLEEMGDEFDNLLHPELKPLVTGHIDVDIENASPDQVLEIAGEMIRDAERTAEREAIDRMKEGVGRGERGAAGIEDTLGALNEFRVEILLLDPSFEAPGVVCTSCGWLGTPGPDVCPFDGGELEERDNIGENAVEKALSQSADAMVVQYHGDLRPLGAIAAVLRF